jgi:Domain of unknown function (DUF4189)
MHSVRRPALRASLAAALLLVLVGRPGPAAADGALAVGLPGDVAAEGFAYGFALDEATPEKASAGALRDCKTETPGVDPRAQALCAVVRTFKNQCFAVAMDPKDATPGVGWAIERDKDSAARGALAKCAATAGDDRRDACEVTHSGCDGGAK